MALRVRDVPVGEVRPYARNPRVNDAAVGPVAESIREFGFRQPIVVDADGTIVAGHTRYRAALSLGMETVPVVVAADLTPEQAAAYRLADNRTAELADWDAGLLGDELDGLLDFDMGRFGFDEDGRGVGSDAPATEFEDVGVPESAPPRCSPGQLWLLGDHRLVCGDSTDPAALDLAVGDGDVRLLLTDPPYNVGVVGKTPDGLKIANDSMPEGEFVRFLASALSNCSRRMAPGAPFYVWFASMHAPSFASAIEDAGLEWRQVLVWAKSAFSLGRQDYQWKHEPCMYGWKPGAPHRFFGGRSQTTVWEYGKPSRNADHPTMKPVHMFGRCVANSTMEGDAVLDPFGAAGRR